MLKLRRCEWRMRALSTHGATNDVGRVMHLTTVPELKHGGDTAARQHNHAPKTMQTGTTEAQVLY